MYLVDTEVKPSDIHGVGVFTKVCISKGTTLWVFDAAFDKSFSDRVLSTLPNHIQNYVHRHGYMDSIGLWLMDGGSNLYVNYSANPNVIVDPEWDGRSITAPLIAARDIEAGEELTECYGTYDLRVDLKGV